MDKVKWQNVYLNDKKYEHFQDANNSYLIADQFKEKIVLPRKYSAVGNQFLKKGENILSAYTTINWIFIRAQI